MFLELDVWVYYSFDLCITTAFKFNSLRASLLTVLRVVYAIVRLSSDVRKILTGVRENVAKTAIETMFSRSYVFTHRCATCNQMSAVRQTCFPREQNRFGEIFDPDLAWKWGCVLL